MSLPSDEERAPPAARRGPWLRLALLGIGAVALIAAVWGSVREGAPKSGDVVREAPRAPVTAEDKKRAHVLARLELDRAQQALADGDLPAARSFAKQALALDEGAADALRLLAVVEKRAGDPAEACRLMRDYVRRAATPEPARARLLSSACEAAPAP